MGRLGSGRVARVTNTQHVQPGPRLVSGAQAVGPRLGLVIGEAPAG